MRRRPGPLPWRPVSRPTAPWIAGLLLLLVLPLLPLLPSSTLAGQVREEADIDRAAIYHAAVEAAGERIGEPNVPVATRMLALQPDGTRRTAGTLPQPTRNRIASTGHQTVELARSLVCPLGWPGPLCELPRTLRHVVRLGGVERDGDHAVVVLAILEPSEVERRPIRTSTYELALTLVDGEWTATEWTLIGLYEEEQGGAGRGLSPRRSTP